MLRLRRILVGGGGVSSMAEALQSQDRQEILEAQEPTGLRDCRALRAIQGGLRGLRAILETQAIRAA